MSPIDKASQVGTRNPPKRTSHNSLSDSPTQHVANQGERPFELSLAMKLSNTW